MFLVRRENVVDAVFVLEHSVDEPAFSLLGDELDPMLFGRLARSAGEGMVW